MRTAAAVRAVRDVDERARGAAVEQRVEEPQRPVCVRVRARVRARVFVCVLFGEAVLMMELPRRHSTPREGGPVRTH